MATQRPSGYKGLTMEEMSTTELIDRHIQDLRSWEDQVVASAGKMVCLSTEGGEELQGGTGMLMGDYGSGPGIQSCELKLFFSESGRGPASQANQVRPHWGWHC